MPKITFSSSFPCKFDSMPSACVVTLENSILIGTIIIWSRS